MIQASEGEIEIDPKKELRLASGLRIPLSEIEFRFVRSSGPGGQHVNKTSTQAELTFDIAGSPSIPDSDRRWILSRLGSRLDANGVLRITAQEYRSQLRNKTEALDKLAELLEQAMHRPKKRKATKPSRSAKEKRLKSKKIRSETKAGRSQSQARHD